MWLSISLSWGTGADVCCWCSTKAQTLNIIRYQCHLTFGYVYFWSILWRKIEFYCHLSISYLYLWFLSLVEITVTFPVLLYFLVITLFVFFFLTFSFFACKDALKKNLDSWKENVHFCYYFTDKYYTFTALSLLIFAVWEK